MIGNNHTHSTHSIKIYGGVYICTTCGNTAHNKVLELRKSCTRPKAHGQANLRAYKRGVAPRGFPDWPYKQIFSMHDVVLENIQGHINNIARAYTWQATAPPTPSESENNSDNEEGPAAGTPSSGMSVSDSD